MTCDEYYLHHPEPELGFPRCQKHEIEAGTARAVALLGASTTLFGVLNLFFTGWTIKVIGIKRALMITILMPALRLVVQTIGVQTGNGLGIAIIQCSQMITVLGGPAGYLLACNSFAAEVVEPSERTATLGRLTGCSLFGTSAGFLLGGQISDHFGIVAPFRVAVLLFLASVAYAAIFLPHVPLNKEIEAKASASFKTFLDPLKIFVPQKWRLPNGKVQREYGTLLVGIGVFLGVFATGYIPVLLQMYATDAFGFTPNENGWLISANCLVRGLFLTLAFPAIISRGRKWLDKRTNLKRSPPHLKGSDYLPSSPAQLASVPGVDSDETEPINIPSPSTETESYHFDLFYIKFSLVADGILTAGATFTTQGWQMYLVAVLIPLAAGAGSSAKGTILQMCEPSQRADALGAISLVEMMARLSTSKPYSSHRSLSMLGTNRDIAGLFGLIFSAFAAIGKPHYTFAINGVSSTAWHNSGKVSLTIFTGCRASSICGNALRKIPSRRCYKM
jgi:MFS family permease